MLVGTPREVKTHEHRVGLTPASVREMRARGHEVLVETMAGHAIGLDDDEEPDDPGLGGRSRAMPSGPIVRLPTGHCAPTPGSCPRCGVARR